MNKSESKYFNTAIKMDIAFMEILGEKDFEYISVKEICEKAGVNRSTFYLHYETIGDLLDESIRYMNDKFLEYYQRDGVSIAGKIDITELEDLYLVTPKFLKPYMEYIKEHRKLFVTAMERGSMLGLADTYDRMFQHILSPVMDRFQVAEQDKKYLSAFYMNGILAVIKIWISNDCQDDIDYIIKIICGRIHAKER